MTDFLYDTETVTWGKNGKKSLTVRGLSSEDLTVAIRHHKESLDKLFNLVEGKLQLENDQLTGFGMELMDQFPSLVALLIALAADMPNRAGEVQRLPVPVQLRLIEAIYQLTIEDTGGLNDFLSRVFTLLRQVRTTMPLPNLKQEQVDSPNTGT